MTMKKAAFIFGILTIGLVVGFDRNTSIQNIRNDNSKLKSQAEEVPKLESEIARLETINIDTNALEKLRDETVELMRLRADAARLRPLADQPKPELEQQIKQSESQFDLAKAAYDHEMKLLIDSSNSGVMWLSSSDLSERISTYINKNEQYPASIETFSRDFLEINSTIEGVITAGVDYQYTTIESVNSRDFELVVPPVSMEDLNRETIIFRERNPRELLNGGWERYYGILRPDRRPNNLPYRSNVYAVKVELEDGDFEKWEREFAEQNSSN